MSVKDLINAIASGSAVETEQVFNQVMAEKISARLDDMRVGVAQSMFSEGYKKKMKEEVEQLDEYWAKGTVNGKKFHIKTNDEYSHDQIHKQNPHLSSDEAKAVHSHTMTDRFIDGGHHTQ